VMTAFDLIEFIECLPGAIVTAVWLWLLFG
jgi:hypothetical protein